MFCYDEEMRDLVTLFVHVIATLARLLGPGGIRSVVAESVLVKQQLLILNRSRQRSPNLRTSDRLVAGLCALLIRPARLIRSAIVLKPSTLLSLHHDPLYWFGQWQANLRILEVTEIKTVPYVPLSHPFVERHWYDSTRIPGSHVVLDDCGPRKQVARVQEILQRSSLPHCTARANASPQA